MGAPDAVEAVVAVVVLLESDVPLPQPAADKVSTRVSRIRGTNRPCEFTCRNLPEPELHSMSMQPFGRLGATPEIASKNEAPPVSPGVFRV
ncbi:hypothetical protein MINTM019_44690 [Mycobacterium paraintracellulare]|nr:hypothetical protein MINTM003_43060 [Mycobacterium paraintracellulare]BCO85816.1 hypothetical protein MINTM011_41510 [Mycobacterium paraintracellulare]BCP07013.1 hypothetical protein MINTM019_44690 [Mycobacterium paraintracellulare]